MVRGKDIRHVGKLERRTTRPPPAVAIAPEKKE